LDKVLNIDYKSFGKDIIITGYSGPNWFVTEDLREYFYNKKPDRTRYPKQITPEEFKKNDFTKINGVFLESHRPSNVYFAHSL